MKRQKIENIDFFKKYVTKDIYFFLSRYLSLKDMVNIALCGRSYYFNSLFTSDNIWKPIVKKVYDILKVYNFPTKDYFFNFINLPKTFSFERWKMLGDEKYLKSVLNVYYERHYKCFTHFAFIHYDSNLYTFSCYYIESDVFYNCIKFTKYNSDPKIYIFHGQRLIKLIYERDLKDEYERLFLFNNNNF